MKQNRNDRVYRALDRDQAQKRFARTVPHVHDVARGGVNLQELCAAVGRGEKKNDENGQNEGDEGNERFKCGHRQSSPSNCLRSRAQRVTR